jgi:hypothetical protein
VTATAREVPTDFAAQIQQKADGGAFAAPKAAVRNALDRREKIEVAWMTNGELKKTIPIVSDRAHHGELIPAYETGRKLRGRTGHAGA